MPRKWTKAQREAQSIRIKAAWVRRRAAAQQPKTPPWAEVDHKAAEDMARAKLVPAQMTWWQRVMQAVGFRHGA